MCSRVYDSSAEQEGKKACKNFSDMKASKRTGNSIKILHMSFCRCHDNVSHKSEQRKLSAWIVLCFICRVVLFSWKNCLLLLWLQEWCWDNHGGGVYSWGSVGYVGRPVKNFPSIQSFSCMWRVSHVCFTQESQCVCAAEEDRKSFLGDNTSRIYNVQIFFWKCKKKNHISRPETILLHTVFKSQKRSMNIHCSTILDMFLFSFSQPPRFISTASFFISKVSFFISILSFFFFLNSSQMLYLWQNYMASGQHSLLGEVNCKQGWWVCHWNQRQYLNSSASNSLLNRSPHVPSIGMFHRSTLGSRSICHPK